MADAVDVAYYMLKVAPKDNLNMTNLKLQKLVYISHGYMLAIHGTNLINENPQAWRYGPVIHSVYLQFKGYKDRPININTDQLEKFSLNDNERDLIDDVLEAYGTESAIDLVNLTHEEGTPWDEIWNKRKGKKDLFAEIPHKLIKRHFKKAITDAESINGL